MKKIVKVHGGKTNQNINVPKAWLEFLQLEKGSEVVIELDVKSQKIIIKKK